MSSKISIKVQKDSIPICAKNAESNCRCFSNNGIHDGWAQGRPSLADSGRTKRRACLLHVDRRRQRNNLQYLKEGKNLKFADKNDQLTIQRLSTDYIICSETLYRRLYDGIHLLCVIAKEAQQIIEEVHESHMNAHMLSQKIMKQGYYWTTIEADRAAHI